MTPTEQINQWLGTFQFWINLNLPIHRGGGISQKEREYRRNWARKRMQDIEYLRKYRERRAVWLVNNKERTRAKAKSYYSRNRERILAKIALKRRSLPAKPNKHVQQTDSHAQP